MLNNTHILAIESSCDDTSVSILKNKKVLSNIVSSQLVHRDYGGVIPEIASRNHEKNIIPVCRKALEMSEIELSDVDTVAFTKTPGLMGSLLVGSSFAKSLSLSLDVPLVEVNHIHAHILAHFIEDEEQKKPEFPFLCLTVSGGHTQMVMVNDYFDIEVVGSTLDDAAGEAFDKIGKIIGLDYPAGAIIDNYAKRGNSDIFTFSKPKTKNKFDFSFSGLKTNVLRFLEKKINDNPSFIRDNLNDICASVQKTIVDILIEKILITSDFYKINRIAISGGVSANSQLRKSVKKLENTHGMETFLLKNEYTTDNAAMVGIVGYFKYINGHFCDLDV